jgi:formate hydrogenlyase transcriptional activator
MGERFANALIRKRSDTRRKQTEDELRTSYAEITRLRDKLEAENRYLREEVASSCEAKEIIGRSDVIKYVHFRINQVASLETTVLIVGDTGTGKGLVAKAVHEASLRRDRPMIHVNCAVLPANLIESELFGREKGAFTGAQAKQIGRFELAHKGTIFLDEIAELPVELQAKLLRVVETGEFERLGDPRTVKVDVRVISSTNRNLEEEIHKGRFREDLFYRLNVFPITVPPLRQRYEDIPLIVDALIERLNKQLGRRISTVPQEVMLALQSYSWPGNVRELENVIERAVIMSRGPVLQLSEQLGASSPHPRPPAVPQTELAGLAEVECTHIRKTLEAVQWRIEGPKGAAHALGMKPSTLRDRMQKLK